MAMHFERTVGALRAAGAGWTRVWIVGATVAIAALGAWSALARVTLYERAAGARLEVAPAAHHASPTVEGRIAGVLVAVGARVEAGDPIVTLDDEPQRRALAEVEAERAGAIDQADAVEEELEAAVEAVERARAERNAELARMRADHAVLEATAVFKEEDAAEVAALFDTGSATARETRVAKTEATLARLRAEADTLAIAHAERRHESAIADRVAAAATIRAELAGARARLDTLEARAATLRSEIEQRTVRAPVGGVIASVAPVAAGDVVAVGETLATVLPEGPMVVVARLDAAGAIGRVHAGQRARVRFEGFPWSRYGETPGVVQSVAMDDPDGFVRVEIAIDADAAASAGIPLRHAMPGGVEIAIDRVSPAGLLLRAAGRRIDRATAEQPGA